jgi:hypothetical protein
MTSPELERFVRTSLTSGENVVWSEERETGGMFGALIFVLRRPDGGFLAGARGGWGALGVHAASTLDVAREHAERLLREVA